MVGEREQYTSNRSFIFCSTQKCYIGNPNRDNLSRTRESRRPLTTSYGIY